MLTYWPKVIETSAIHKEPHRVAFYLIELSSVFHSLWSWVEIMMNYGFQKKMMLLHMLI